jgi:hypothetical protein
MRPAHFPSCPDAKGSDECVAGAPTRLLARRMSRLTQPLSPGPPADTFYPMPRAPLRLLTKFLHA